jgi:hypothetical protein
MAKLLPAFVEKHSLFRISNIFSIGLAATREALDNNCATSADFIALISGIQRDPVAVPVEVKSSVTASTAQRLRELARDDPFQYVEVSFNGSGESIFEKAIPDPAHRNQVIMHAYALGTRFVLYVQGDRVDVRRVRLISFHESCITMVGRLLKDLLTLVNYNDIIRKCQIYDKATVEKLEESLKIDTHAFSQYLNMGSLIRSLPSTPPPCVKVLPAAVHLWNKLKSHSDVHTRILNEHKPLFKASPIASLAIRTIFSQLINFYRISGLLKLEEREPRALDLILGDIQRKNGTFREFLLDFGTKCEDYFTKMRSSIPNAPTISSPPHKRLHRDTQLTFLTASPSTPGSRTWWNLAKEHVPRISDQKRRRACIVCGKKTYHRCFACTAGDSHPAVCLNNLDCFVKLHDTIYNNENIVIDTNNKKQKKKRKKK